MAFNPSYDMPVNWLYSWYQGFVSALQGEINKEYGYGSYDDFKKAWGTFNISTSDINPNAYNMMSDLAAYAGNTDVATAALPVMPLTVMTDDGPREVIATGTMIAAATGEAVRLKIDGFLTSIPWDTVVAEVMLANNYQIQPNMLTELSCKLASEITGQIITNTDGLYVTGKVGIDSNDVARSYVDDFVVQGLLDGAAASGLLTTIELDDYEIGEVVPTIQAPPGNVLPVLLWQALTGSVFAASNDVSSMSGFDTLRTQSKLTTIASIILAHFDTTTPGWYSVNAEFINNFGTPNWVVGVTKIPQGRIQNSKFDSAGVWPGTMLAAIQPTNSTNWYTTPSGAGVLHQSWRFRPNGTYEMLSGAYPFYTGTGIARVNSDDCGLFTAGNILSQTVVAPEIELHDIDTWGPTKESHAIDELWPGWLDGARIGAGAIDIDSNVWFPTRDFPLGIDQTDVQNPGQTIARDYAGVQAGALAGAETGAITITDTIADAITIPSIYNPAIAIPATIAPTPTPTPIIPVLPPSVSAQRLYTVHQVRQDQIDALGAYLWSNDFISLIEHMFTEPIDAVIGLHTLFYGGSLPVGSSETIKLGAISATGCTGQPVQNQYMKFQCGSVNIPEYWNNATDYNPYTKSEIFLPFIGFRDLDINEIMGGSVSLSYGIDIFTGACVAMIGVMRDHVSQALYTFEGNCAVQQPVTGADYSRIVGGLISAGMGIATGGVGAVLGVAGALTSHKIAYNRSGNISANAGACMPKTPYIIIKRPNAYDAPNYRAFYGDPANWTVTLGSCSGYTRIKDVHLDNVACTDVEKDEIIALLKSGVIF